MGDKIALFKTKEEVLLAMGRGDVEIVQDVLKNESFNSADPRELLGFIAESGGDFKIIEVKAVRDNPREFFNLAFGGTNEGN